MQLYYKYYNLNKYEERIVIQTLSSVHRRRLIREDPSAPEKQKESLRSVRQYAGGKP
jgi:ribosome recycling factor